MMIKRMVIKSVGKNFQKACVGGPHAGSAEEGAKDCTN